MCKFIDQLDKRPKWPKRLQMTTKQQFDIVGFYVIVYEGTQHLNHLLLGLIMLVVLVTINNI